MSQESPWEVTIDGSGAGTKVTYRGEVVLASNIEIRVSSGEMAILALEIPMPKVEMKARINEGCIEFINRDEILRKIKTLIELGLIDDDELFEDF